MLLSVPVGCPIPIMYWDCAGLTMKHRIVQKKLLLLHHIANLDNNSLAKKIFNVQTKLSFPGLVEECQEYLVMFGAGLLTNYTKQQWKIFVIKNILKLNRETLLEKMKSSYKKLDHKIFEQERFELKPYLTDLQMDEARDYFRIRSFMTKSIKMNFASDPSYKKYSWKCDHCINIDTQSHVRHCEAYEHFRVGKDLDNDRYYRQVIDMRESEENY